MSYQLVTEYRGEETLVVVTELKYYPEQPGTRYQEHIPEYVEIEAGYCVTSDPDNTPDFDTVFEDLDLFEEFLELYKRKEEEEELDCRVGNCL